MQKLGKKMRGSSLLLNHFLEGPGEERDLVIVDQRREGKCESRQIRLFVCP
jgi:hypothetical protein